MNKVLLFIVAVAFLLTSCSVSKYSSVNQYSSFDEYKYFVVTEASSVVGSTGGAYGNQFGVYGSQVTKTANPTDLIAGHLMKKGFIRLSSTNEDRDEKTMIVSYGDGGRHMLFWGYATEVILQFLDAKTMDVIAVVSAAAMGETESDKVKKAINKCFKVLFPQ